MKRFVAVVLAGVVFGGIEFHAQSTAVAAEAVNGGNAIYARPFEPPTRQALLALPPGAVEPEGWLRDWCLGARDGYTGHMDAVHEAFRQAWALFDTYTWTGNQALAAKLTALFALDGRGGDFWNRYCKKPNAQPGTEGNDHVVHFLESTTPWGLGYLWTGNRELLDATLAWHGFLERVAMQPSGVPVADEWYGPTGAFRGAETCDVAGYVWSKAMPIEWEVDWKDPTLPNAPFAKNRASERIPLIPYGCTKFRVSMFPITERISKAVEAQEHPEKQD